MSSLEMMLETGNVTLPALHTTICYHPNLLCNLVYEPEVMTDKDKAAVPLCISNGHL